MKLPRYCSASVEQPAFVSDQMEGVKEGGRGAPGPSPKIDHGFENLVANQGSRQKEDIVRRMRTNGIEKSHRAATVSRYCSGTKHRSWKSLYKRPAVYVLR
ncbi:jg21150 [Pararge aegeria aegeria]|uniref:Jg21150 protein n=1 Tax=Pararge aegeria aegeria TaxID=348720 RepID=A0A8S4SIL0_9NEOP|nr:jg21150 [Pararge aegeria aegeria]